jgi:mRNA-degrading endonuclease RelE of RelBE toxin-antitoxin system
VAPKRVGYRESAALEFQLVPGSVQREIKDALERVARNFPDIPPELDVERVRGTESLWRLAVGEYRCVFRMEEHGLVVFGVGLRPGFYLRFG